MKRLCVICVRAGSKGVEQKNLKPLHGKPLLAHTLEQATESGKFDTIAVSTDGVDIREAARRYGANCIVNRPAELALDESPKIPAIRHCTSIAEDKTGFQFDTIVDLDVTSPLRSIDDIANAISLLEKSGASNIVSAMPSRRSPYFNLVELDEGDVVKLCKPSTQTVTRRQDAPPCYDLNASVFVWTRKTLFSGKDTVFCENTKLYIMPEERSIDIDSALDFEFVEFLMNKKNG